MLPRSKIILQAGSFVLFLVSAVSWFYWTNNDRFELRDANSCTKDCVPNIVHYIIFGKNSLDFISYLSILSVLKVQKPEQLIIHSDSPDFGGNYWLAIKSAPFNDTSIHVSLLEQPTHVFGQRLSSVYHSADVARIQILMQHGGIYLDTDMLVLRSLDRYRNSEMVVAWPYGEYIGNQILIASKNAKFLSMWLNSYRSYHPREWYYNAGKVPTEQILQKHPELAHREHFAFGVTNLGANLYGASPWPQWRLLSAVHLLSRHPPAPQHLDEKFVRTYRSPFGEISRWLLYKLKPRVVIPSSNVSTASV
ncbi:uncharacterized protein LOC126262395 [Schistocerca nitens]|uniref:uncharacterized protein LOC126262395 n=1 Tax=Schistocerca nitens TaxID=7011 RepID=UPI0021193A2C|nr:uncharacterized protein LOC126262395 [Schistocerca nitens]